MIWEAKFITLKSMQSNFHFVVVVIFPDAAVADITAPTFTYCPLDLSAYTSEGSSGTSVSWNEPVATDNSDTVFYSRSHKPDDQFPVGSTTVTYYARDISGNQATCTFTVTVLGKVCIHLHQNCRPNLLNLFQNDCIEPCFCKRGLICNLHLLQRKQWISLN